MEEKLSNRQVRNLNALALKKQEIDRRWSGKIKIVDTEETMKNEDGILAMPMGGIKGKPTAVRLKLRVQDKNEDGKLVEEDRGYMPIPAGHQDVIEALTASMKEHGLKPNGSSDVNTTNTVVQDFEPVQSIGTKVPRKYTHKDMLDFLKK